MTKGRKYTRYFLMPIALILKEKKKESKLDGFSKWTLFMRGFLSSTQILLGLENKNYKEFLSDYHEMKTGAINGDSAYYLNNKIEFVEMIKNHINVPESLGVVNKGQFYSYSPEMPDLSHLMTYLENHQKIVHKPIFGAEGRGVSIIKLDQGRILQNSQEISLEDLNAYIMASENFFLSEYIQQSDFGNSLYPDSLNTMRILTMVDPQTDKSFVAAAMQRIGTHQSAPTDNYSRRGAAFNINLESGILEEGIHSPNDNSLVRLTCHPDTKEVLVGLKIPNWSELKESLTEVCDYIYQRHGIKYVGWDVVHTDKGFEILEGNSWPGIDFHQLYQPFLADDRIRAFYEYHKII